MIDSLQLTAPHPVATPADWHKGDRVIASLSLSTDEARQKLANVEEVKPDLRWADEPTAA